MGGTPNPTQGFEYKLADGTVVKADTIEDAFKTVAKMKEDTAAALRESRQNREELQQQMNQLQAEVAKRTQAPADPGQFNRDYYYRLVGEDPVMAANYVDSFRLGIPDPQQVPGYFQNAFQTLTKMEQDYLAASFVNVHPDFPANRENADTLTKEAIRLMGDGHPMNMDTLEIAWQNCVASERIKPAEVPDEREEVNPAPGGSGAAVADSEVSRIEEDVVSGKMSMADFEKYLRSKGAMG